MDREISHKQIIGMKETKNRQPHIKVEEQSGPAAIYYVHMQQMVNSTKCLKTLRLSLTNSKFLSKWEDCRSKVINIHTHTKFKEERKVATASFKLFFCQICSHLFISLILL